MRVIVVGAGLAGALLAWRLRDAGAAVTLIGGMPAARSATDATGASGGIVRAFEPDPRLRVLATASLSELRGDPQLRNRAGYQEVGSLYLTTGPVPDPPAGADLLPVADVHRRFGLSGLPGGVVGVYERHAGYMSPHLLRQTALGRLGSIVDAVVSRVVSPATVRLCGGGIQTADAVVLATGPWTPGLLGATGGAAIGHPVLSTKHIQFSVHVVAGTALPALVDETTGLYGRPAGPGRMLLGVPGDRYGVDPERPVADPTMTERALAAARRRLPEHRIGVSVRTAVACDCYCEPAGLALRRLADGLFTFTGGSGGAAKTALAASRAAATELIEMLTPVGGR